MSQPQNHEGRSPVVSLDGVKDSHSHKLACALIGCGVTIILMILIAGTGAAYLLFQRGKQDIMPLATKYFDAIEAEDYEAAYALFSPAYQGSHSLDEFREERAVIRERYGPIRDRRLQSFRGPAYMGIDAGARARFLTEYDEGRIVVTLHLSGKDETMVITNTTYEGPLIEELYRCPTCQERSEFFAKYCSHCGGEMAWVKKDEERRDGAAPAP